MQFKTLGSQAPRGLTLRLDANTISGSTSDGINFLHRTGFLVPATFSNVTATNNIINSNGDNGAYFQAFDTSSPCTLNLIFNDNTLNGNTSTGFVAEQTNTDTAMCLQLRENTSSADGGSPDFSLQSPAPPSLASVQAENTGTISTFGTITFVPIGGCP